MSNKNNMNLSTDENIVRIIAAQVVIITAITVVTSWIFPIFLLAIDFALRAFTNQFSPLKAVVKKIAAFLKLKPKPIFAAPKKFAATLGFIFSIIIVVLLFLEFYYTAKIVGSFLILFAILESGFNICVGCYFYNWIIAPIVNKRNNYLKT